VAIETIRIINERNLLAHVASVGAHLQKQLRELASHPLVGEVRGVGLIAAVELVADRASKRAGDTPGQLGARLNGLLQDRGVISRNMVDALAFCPPLIITHEEVDELVGRLSASLDDAVHPGDSSPVSRKGG
jgi:4-aminobutyrate--pyruvate transaminase